MGCALFGNTLLHYQSHGRNKHKTLEFFEKNIQKFIKFSDPQKVCKPIQHHICMLEASNWSALRTCIGNINSQLIALLMILKLFIYQR